MTIDGMDRHVKIERRRKKKSDVRIRNEQVINMVGSNSGSSIKYDEKDIERDSHCNDSPHENIQVEDNVRQLHRHVFARMQYD